MINDYYLLNHINDLFDRRNILYGAGCFGRKTAEIFSIVGIKIDCFCDRVPKENFLGKKVISAYELKRRYDLGEALNIIICSEKYYTEIEKDLITIGIEKNVYTYFGAGISIGLHIGNKRFSAETASWFIAEKERQAIANENRKENNVLEITEKCPDILIYQAGKVGSSSVFETLTEYGVKAFHLHYLMKYDRAKTESVVHYLQNRHIKIITMVREPIKRGISEIFEFIGIDAGREYKDQNVENYVLEKLELLCQENSPFLWFFSEVKALTGIDIYDYPFDRERGYSIIRSEKADILILQTEKMTQNEGIIGEFCGIPDFKLKKKNVSKEKLYGEAYRKVQENLKVPKEIVDRYYIGNRLFDHFYSEQDKEKFLKRI